MNRIAVVIALLAPLTAPALTAQPACLAVCPDAISVSCNATSGEFADRCSISLYPETCTSLGLADGYYPYGDLQERCTGTDGCGPMVSDVRWMSTPEEGICTVAPEATSANLGTAFRIGPADDGLAQQSLCHELQHACADWETTIACTEVPADQVSVDVLTCQADTHCGATPDWPAQECAETCQNLAFVLIASSVDQCACQLAQQNGGTLTIAQCLSCTPNCEGPPIGVPASCNGNFGDWWPQVQQECLNYWANTGHTCEKLVENPFAP